MWQGTFTLPAGSYEYKAALNDSWTENYGLHAAPDGANIPLSLPSADSVKFYYDHESHWITDNHSSVIAVAPGSFQSELGCPGDWDPTCLRSWLQDPDGDGIYSFSTTKLPAGSYEAKVAINESWDTNYGQGGVLNGSNISFNVPVDGTQVTFGYDAATHVLTVTVATPAGAPGWPGALSHFDLARKDCVGTARNTTSKVWFTVANGVLSDVYYPTIDNTNVETLQYIVTDGSTFTDLQTRDMTSTVAAIDERAAWPAGHRDGEERALHGSSPTTSPTRPATHVADATSGSRRRAGARLLQLYVRFDPTVNGNGGGGAGNGGADSATSTDRPATRCSWHPTPTRRPTRPTATTRSLSIAALDGPFAQATNGFVGAASDGLAQLDATHTLTRPYDSALGRQRRPGRAGRASVPTARPCSRSASAHAGRGRGRRRGVAAAPFD